MSVAGSVCTPVSRKRWKPQAQRKTNGWPHQHCRQHIPPIEQNNSFCTTCVGTPVTLWVASFIFANKHFYTAALDAALFFCFYVLSEFLFKTSSRQAPDFTSPETCTIIVGLYHLHRLLSLAKPCLIPYLSNFLSANSCGCWPSVMPKQGWQWSENDKGIDSTSTAIRSDKYFQLRLNIAKLSMNALSMTSRFDLRSSLVHINKVINSRLINPICIYNTRNTTKSHNINQQLYLWRQIVFQPTILMSFEWKSWLSVSNPLML